MGIFWVGNGKVVSGDKCNTTMQRLRGNVAMWEVREENGANK